MSASVEDLKQIIADLLIEVVLLRRHIAELEAQVPQPPIERSTDGDGTH